LPGRRSRRFTPTRVEFRVFSSSLLDLPKLEQGIFLSSYSAKLSRRGGRLLSPYLVKPSRRGEVFSSPLLDLSEQEEEKNFLTSYSV